MYLPSYSNSKMTTRQPGLVPKISLRITNPLFRTITIEAAFQPPDHTPGHSLCPVVCLVFQGHDVFTLPCWEILPRRRNILRLCLLPHIPYLLGKFYRDDVAYCDFCSRISSSASSQKPRLFILSCKLRPLPRFLREDL
jgi:hypothetical protein